MKRRLLGFSVAAAMILAATTAWAAGVNLGWQNCQSEGGTANRPFACNTNNQGHILVSSFVLDADKADVSGNELVIDFLSAVNPMPLWWELGAGGCRSAIGVNTVVNGANTICTDWALGGSTGGSGGYSQELGSINPGLQPQHRRLKIAVAVPPTALGQLVAGEYFTCNVVINNSKTVGTGACAGCTDPVCIVLNSIKITTPVPANDVVLGAAAAPGSNIVTWQGVGPDCQLVPTRNETWGAVKAMYR